MIKGIGSNDTKVEVTINVARKRRFEL